MQLKCILQVNRSKQSELQNRSAEESSRRRSFVLSHVHVSQQAEWLADWAIRKQVTQKSVSFLSRGLASSWCSFWVTEMRPHSFFPSEHWAFSNRTGVSVKRVLPSRYQLVAGGGTWSGFTHWLVLNRLFCSCNEKLAGSYRLMERPLPASSFNKPAVFSISST